MSIETTLTLLLAAVLLLAGGFAWLLVWGLIRSVRYLLGVPESSRSKDRKPIFPRLAHAGGFVAGRLSVIGRRTGARLGSIYAELKAQAKPAIQRTASSTGHRLAIAGSVGASGARMAGKHLVTIAQFIAAHAYAGIRKDRSWLDAYGEGAPLLPNGPEARVHSESPHLPPRAEVESRR